MHTLEVCAFRVATSAAISCLISAAIALPSITSAGSSKLFSTAKDRIFIQNFDRSDTPLFYGMQF
jgi:hypothetical protein